MRTLPSRDRFAASLEVDPHPLIISAARRREDPTGTESETYIIVKFEYGNHHCCNRGENIRWIEWHLLTRSGAHLEARTPATSALLTVSVNRARYISGVSRSVGVLTTDGFVGNDGRGLGWLSCVSECVEVSLGVNNPLPGVAARDRGFWGVRDDVDEKSDTDSRRSNGVGLYS